MADKKVCCPNCGAPIEGETCAYCGTKRPAQTKKQNGTNPVTQKKAWILTFVIFAVVFSVTYACQYASSHSISEFDLIASWFGHNTDNGESGTREDPIPWGKIVEYTDGLYDYTVEVSLTQVLRGSAALEIVQAADEYMDPLGAGQEYMLVKVKIKGRESEDGEAIRVSDTYNFSCCSQSGTAYEDAYVSNLKPELSDIYPGGETEGYLCFMVEENDSPLVGYQGSSISNIVWLETNET